MNGDMMENTEREIDLIDLMEYICVRWRRIIAFMLLSLILAVLVSTGMAYYKVNQAKSDLTDKSVEKALEKALEELEKTENGDDLRAIADDKLRSYEYKRKLYQMQEDYMDHSIYFSINEDMVCRGKLSYYIDNHYEITYPTINSYNNIGDITGYYSARLLSNQVYDRIISDVYPASEYKYIRELIGVNKATTGNLEILITADSEDNVRKISSILKSEIKLINRELEDDYGPSDCILQSDQYTIESDRAMADSHTAELQKLIDLQDAMQNIEKSMTGPQLDYFKARLRRIQLDEAGEAGDQLSLRIHLSKKLLVGITLFGTCLVLGIYFCSYIFSGSLKTRDELALLTGAVHFGSLEETASPRHSVDKLVYRIFHGSKAELPLADRIEIAAGFISESMKKQSMQKLCIVSSTDLSSQTTVTSLREALTAADITVDMADRFLTNPEAMKKANAADRILMIEQCKHSRYTDIEQELRLLRTNAAEVLGSVSL